LKFRPHLKNIFAEDNCKNKLQFDEKVWTGSGIPDLFRGMRGLQGDPIVGQHSKFGCFTRTNVTLSRFNNEALLCQFFQFGSFA